MSLVLPENKTKAQQAFEAKYITSGEITHELKVSRSTVLHARRRGLLPDAIDVNNGQFFIWEREPLNPHLEAWKLILKIRREG